jgi:aminoglycoside 3-N-acetyltransferase
MGGAMAHSDGMSTVAAGSTLRTRPSLTVDLRKLGVRTGDVLLVHSSLSSIGWVCGGAVAVVGALLDALGPTGTLVVPTQSADNSEPARWRYPPVPADWWPAIRATMPAYDPDLTPSSHVGVIPEVARRWPGAVRSAHPQVSFAAIGPEADDLMSPHPLDCRFGESSPLARLEQIDARVLLLGAGFDACTAFHLAEYRTPAAPRASEGCAILEEGRRHWVWYTDVACDSEDFAELGAAFVASFGRPARRAADTLVSGLVGQAWCQLFRLADAVEFAATWIPKHRQGWGG